MIQDTPLQSRLSGNLIIKNSVISTSDSNINPSSEIGRLLVRAGNVQMQDSTISLKTNTVPFKSEGMNMLAKSLKISGSRNTGSNIYSLGFGDVVLEVADILLENGSIKIFQQDSRFPTELRIKSDRLTILPAGNIAIGSGIPVLKDNNDLIAYFNSDVNTSINIEAGEIFINGGFIGAYSNARALTTGVNVKIMSDMVTLQNSARIATASETEYAVGFSGNLTIDATKRILIDNSVIGTQDTRTNSAVKTGEINISSDEIILKNSGQIITASNAPISVISDINLNANEILIDNGIVSTDKKDSFSGSAGNINIAANKLTLQNTGSISSNIFDSDYFNSILLSPKEIEQLRTTAINLRRDKMQG